jgi:hypothetical protein
MTELARVQALVRARSPLPAEATEAVVADAFRTMPRTVRWLRARYGFDRRRVLEIGSHFGGHLLWWGPGSEGVEVRDVAAAFTTAMGCRTHRLNVEDGFGGLAEASFGAIHTNNLLEHLVAPHLFLLRCHRLLAAGGLLVVGHPVVPPAGVRRLWTAAGVRGWLASEHVNFFTPASVRLACERAGFDVVEQLSPAFLRLHPLLARLLLPVAPSCYSVCRKRADFRYDPKRSQVFDPTAVRRELEPFHAAMGGRR